MSMIRSRRSFEVEDFAERNQSISDDTFAHDEENGCDALVGPAGTGGGALVARVTSDTHFEMLLDEERRVG
jgi:hypothetical protein